MKVKVESEKVSLKLNIQKTKIMASGPITSWEIDGETVETVSDFIFLGSKITTDSDCSHEIKMRLLLGSKESCCSNLGKSCTGTREFLFSFIHSFNQFFFPLYHVACGILVPLPGIKSKFTAVKAQVLTTGPPRNPLNRYFLELLL